MVTTFNKKDLISFGKYLFSDERRQLFLDRQEIGTNIPDLEDRIREISHADFNNWKEGLSKKEHQRISFDHTYGEALEAIKEGYWAIRKYAYGRFVIGLSGLSSVPNTGSLVFTELDVAVHHHYIPSFNDQMADDWIIIRDPRLFRNHDESSN
jgi:hypothetical protein